jgi:hypothetical protein
MVRLADGDRGAFGPLYDTLWPVLLGFARRALAGSPDAEDAAQTALMKVFSRACDFDPSRDALSWVLGIAAFECRTLRGCGPHGVPRMEPRGSDPRRARARRVYELGRLRSAAWTGLAVVPFAGCAVLASDQPASVAVLGAALYLLAALLFFRGQVYGAAVGAGLLPAPRRCLLRCSSASPGIAASEAPAGRGA